MTIVGKAVASVATLGTIGGTAILINEFVSNSNAVSPRLTSEGFDTNIGASEWETILNAHNAVQNTKDTFKTEPKQNLKLPELQAKCKSALDIKEDSDYKKARQWCVKEREIGDIFKNINLRTLDFAKKGKDEKVWEAKESALMNEEAKAKKLNVKMAGTPAIDIDKMKEGCKNIIKAKTTDKHFNEKLELAKEWCTTPKN